MRKAHSRAGIALATAAVLFAGACGGSSSGGGDNGNNNGSGDSGGTVIWGSTDKPVSFDPAKAYDLPSWNVIYNVYQTLVRINPDTLKTEPDAAESCDASKDFKTWTCTLKDGLTFSNGNPVTAEDVKFSFDRIMKIADPSGPSGLLAATGGEKFKTVAKDDKTVVFQLQNANALWDQVISTGAGAIVDHTVFPADSIISDESAIIGSGPYVLKSYAPHQTAEFAPNDKDTGDLQLANGEVVQAAHVVLAIGLEGNPRKLGAPGEDLEHSQVLRHLRQLRDPDDRDQLDARHCQCTAGSIGRAPRFRARHRS